MHCNFSWLNLGTLSKDHTEKHNANRGKSDIILRIQNLKNPTLSGETYLYSHIKEYTPCTIRYDVITLMGSRYIMNFTSKVLRLMETSFFEYYRYGYPDHGYLSRVRRQLAAKGFQ